jgi:hypothetical protein
MGAVRWALISHAVVFPDHIWVPELALAPAFHNPLARAGMSNQFWASLARAVHILFGTFFVMEATGNILLNVELIVGPNLTVRLTGYLRQRKVVSIVSWSERPLRDLR